MEFQKLFLSWHESQKLFAVIIVLITASLFVYQLIAFFKHDLTKNIQLQPTVINSNQDKITRQSLLFTKPLFGDYIPVIKDVDIKESTLDVELVGIVFSSRPERSHILIKDAAGNERTYVIGNTLLGGAVIKRINENGVVVLYNNSLESLSLPKHELLFDKPAKPLISEE